MVEKTVADIVAQFAELDPEQLARRWLVAEGLQEILVSLNAGHPLDKTLDAMMGRACDVLGAASAALYCIDWDDRHIALEVGSNLPQDFHSIGKLPIDVLAMLGYELNGATPADALYAMPHLLSTSRLAASCEFSHLFALRSWCHLITGNYRSMVAVPLMVKDEVYGCLIFHYVESKKQIAPEDVQLAVTFGNQASLAIENARLRVQAEQAAVLQERSRLARDLHDSVTQSLYSLTLLAEAGRRMAKTGDMAKVREAIKRLGAIAQQALKEMRLLVYELRPLALKRVGLVGALQHRLDTVEKRAGVEASLFVEGQVALPVHLEEELYHIAQEALNNTLKHAEATTVTVRIVAKESHIDIEVTDNGLGFDAVAMDAEGGIGLSSMRERAEKLGGTFIVQSAPGHGARVKVTLDW